MWAIRMTGIEEQREENLDTTPKTRTTLQNTMKNKRSTVG